MSASEETPLISAISKDDSDLRRKSDAYLLLSMPQSERTFFQRLSRILENHSSTIVGTSIGAIIVIIIIAVTYHVDITEINRGGRNKDSLSATSSGERLVVSDSEGSRILITPLGKIKGYIRKSRGGRDFLAFYKVPYAKSPLGELRFKDPQPAEPWVGTRDETEVAQRCIQKSKKTADGLRGEEDCLYSNIYVPVNAENNEVSSYPTMVYIHGGAYDAGDGGRYGAEYFMDEDVLLITFEYRLGMLGFLNTGDREAAGNMGLKDQIMMLKWVKSYISSLSGDPGRVTLFGNSMGSMSSSFIMLSPMGKNLFHRAIAQSGTALCETKTVTMDMQPEVTAKAVAEAFSCPQETSVELLQCLRAQSARNLANFTAPGTRWGVTIEKGFDPNDLSNVFMPEQPYQLLKSGKLNPVPYLVGVMATELIGPALHMLKNQNAVNTLNSNLSTLLRGQYQLDLTIEESQTIKSFYFGEKTIGNHTERNLTNLLSDIVFVHCSKVTADMTSKHMDTFLYYLSKHPKGSYAEETLDEFPFIDKSETVCHADEVQFLFPYEGFPFYGPSDTEYFPFSQFLVKLWAHFAATGNPVMDPSMESWKPMSSDQSPAVWFELGDNVRLTTVLEERMQFWNQFSHKQLTYEL